MYTVSQVYQYFPVKRIIYTSTLSSRAGLACPSVDHRDNSVDERLRPAYAAHTFSIRLYSAEICTAQA